MSAAPLKLREAVANILANAKLIPDADRGNAADCYAIPLDDFESLRLAADQFDRQVAAVLAVIR